MFEGISFRLPPRPLWDFLQLRSLTRVADDIDLQPHEDSVQMWVMEAMHQWEGCKCIFESGFLFQRLNQVLFGFIRVSFKSLDP